jgi:hypothetical protein
MTRLRRIAPAVALASLGLVMPGCTYSSPPAGDFCVPRITVEPAVVSPGGTITMSSDTACDTAKPPGGWAVLVAPVGQVGLGVSTTVPDEFDGSFSVMFEVPDYFPSGEAFAGISNWDYSDCPDNASCASASGSFTVE